ncbi:uncharacterized protein LOC108161515 isoform X5 [Drosophila miranda]|uniref:uncharacterized protein LOC108161515 isoform X5 n=1 Tax=Drosophila miranda TaxID=7229 RepID=UPI00143F9E9D|nr:uncharacterized protein LOC108161515 isoform X5 [Drosophila miranda]
MRALLMLSLIALSTSIDTRSCFSKSCTAEYRPVCATDEKGKELVRMGKSLHIEMIIPSAKGGSGYTT